MSLSILSTITLIIWAVVVMMSPMMFAAPGAMNTLSTMLMLLAVYAYPSLLFSIHLVLQKNFFSFNPRTCLIASLIIFTAIVLLLDFPRFLFNYARGISNESYAIHQGKVYLDGQKLSRADGNTFQVLSNGYSKDQQHVFYYRKLIADAHAPSFHRFLKNNSEETEFWIDQSHVYAQGKRIPEAQASSFQLLGHRYARDANHVFYGVELLIDVHPDHFTIKKVDGRIYAVHKDQLYYSGQLLKTTQASIDAASFKRFENASEVYFYCADRNGVYFFNASSDLLTIHGADAASFVVLGNGKAKDKKNIYAYDFKTRTIEIRSEGDTAPASLQN